MGARELNRTVPAGISSAPELSRPCRVMQRAPRAILFWRKPERSAGVTQGMSPFAQFDGSSVLGVPPPTTRAISPTVVHTQLLGTGHGKFEMARTEGALTPPAPPPTPRAAGRARRRRADAPGPGRRAD